MFRRLFVYAFGHAAFAPRQDMQDVAKGARTAVLGFSPDAYSLVTAAARELVDVPVGQEPYGLGLDLVLDGIETSLAGQ